jgi:hypothetical protein
MEGGHVQIQEVTGTTIKVRMRLYGDYGFDDATFRMGFRFYVSRLQVGTCSSVTVASSRYGTPYCQSGGTCSATCYKGDRMFAGIFYNYRNAYYQSGWPFWYNGDWYDFTFTFSSVTSDVSNYANEVFVQGTLVYEFTRYHSNDCSKCGCDWCHASTCYETCGNWYDGYYDCRPYACNWQCCWCRSCRWLYGWDYRALTSQDVDGWSQAPLSIAGNVATDMISKQYGVET